HVRITAHEPDARGLLARAVRQAARVQGPTWTLPPPAAPARVSVSDVELAADPEAALASIPARIAFGASSQVTVGHWRVAVERWQTEVRSSVLLASSYPSTLIEVDAFLGDGREPVSARARRLDDLDWGEAVARASTRADARARAVRLAPGSYDLVLAGDALVPEGSEALAPERAAPWHGPAPGSVATTAPGRAPTGQAAFGWFGPLLAQSDARLVRQGLSRYGPGRSIYGSHHDAGHGNAALRGEPLTLTSDGTLPYGVRSRPFGDWGEPTRQLTLIEDGVAVGLLCDLREAALRGIMPTGGPGNVVLPPGRTLPDALRARAGRPVLEAVALAWLAVEPRTGDFAAELDVGFLDDGTAVTGGGFRGNVFTILAGARYSARLAARSWYRGPEAVRVDDVRMT
ncbi:MAG TPA: metallopeptidase TldD-related protein, partial [Haliangium sp.]|nr:metallopeptidase TldD-related protein [Haliangium sp.]